MKAVLYLDFDGVLNDQAWIASAERREIGPVLDNDKAHHDLRPEYVARVQRIIEATGCDVWICSTWRRVFGLNGAVAMLDRVGIHAVGSIPYKFSSNRVHDILRHALDLPLGTRWCVLDDAVETGDVECAGGRAVTPIDGVTEAQADAVIAALRS